mmetsp:Transcript_3723/g.5614  ORF Transcript_3723/g.5614 Transcript_3723/m.5614 type:complete len:80 (-) Transcript_3723:116-355(-)
MFSSDLQPNSCAGVIFDDFRGGVSTREWLGWTTCKLLEKAIIEERLNPYQVPPFRRKAEYLPLQTRMQKKLPLVWDTIW